MTTPHPRVPRALTARNAALYRFIKRGKTFREAAAYYGITSTRAYQIFKKREQLENKKTLV